MRMRVTARRRAGASEASLGLEGEEGEEDQVLLHERHLKDRGDFDQLRVGGSDAADAAAAGPRRTATMRERYSALKPFVIISVSYLLYTVTDGAIRMIVLLHAFQKGFTAMEVGCD